MSGIDPNSVQRLLDDGLTMAGVGEALGVSRQRVQQIVKQHGLLVSVLGRHRDTLARDPEIAADAAAGMKNADIAEKHGLSISSVVCALRRTESRRSREQISTLQSKAHLGKRATAETREKLSAAKRGKSRPPFSQEWRAKIAAGRRAAWERKRAAQDAAQ